MVRFVMYEACLMIIINLLCICSPKLVHNIFFLNKCGVASMWIKVKLILFISHHSKCHVMKLFNLNTSIKFMNMSLLHSRFLICSQMNSQVKQCGDFPLLYTRQFGTFYLDNNFQLLRQVSECPAMLSCLFIHVDTLPLKYVYDTHASCLSL